MGQGPVFIGGLDHSGKTQMRISLSAHPNLALTRRTYMWTRYYNRYGDLRQPKNFERCLAAMLRSRHIRMLQPDPDRIRREFWQGVPTYPRLFALFHEHHAEMLGKPRWGDQLRFIEFYADVIFNAYPTARMIHMIRDPRDRYEISMPSTRHPKGKVGWATARWLDSVKLAKRNQQRYPQQYKIVRYEDLTSQPEMTLRHVCAFLEEEFFPAMLLQEDRLGSENREDDRSRNDAAASIANLDRGSTSRKLISEREAAFILAYSQSDLFFFGYPVDPVRFSPGDKIKFYTFDLPANLAGMIAWRLLKGGRPD
ncbi:MAG: sulfotransferase [Candidatus Methanosuratincola sp.]